MNARVDRPIFSRDDSSWESLLRTHSIQSLVVPLRSTIRLRNIENRDGRYYFFCKCEQVEREEREERDRRRFERVGGRKGRASEARCLHLHPRAADRPAGRNDFASPKNTFAPLISFAARHYALLYWIATFESRVSFVRIHRMPLAGHSNRFHLEYHTTHNQNTSTSFRSAGKNWIRDS